MSGEETYTGGKKQVFYSVFDGSFRTRVPEGFPDALVRVNKNNKEVHERMVPALFGIIENVEFEESDYGKRIKITLDANDEGAHPVISMGVESKDGRDFLRKLPAIDLSKEVRFMPYKFTPDDSDQERSGISITQRDPNDQFTIKVENFFWDKEKTEYKHGHPSIDYDTAKESERKIYLIQRDEFLLDYAIKNVLPKFQNSPARSAPDPRDTVLDTKEEDPNEAIPF